MRETIVKFECDGCHDGAPCKAEFKTYCPDMCRPPENCLYNEEDEDYEPNWKRVELEQEQGDAMHVPVIHEKKSEEEKRWEYSLAVNDGLLSVAAVDSKTGRHVAHLFYISRSGVLKLSTCVEQTILGEGYTLQGLSVDPNGRVIHEY